jgi:hypothetical protein
MLIASMRFIRERLSCVVAGWLACQMAGLGAVSVSAACAETGPRKCCAALRPGQTCPMHHPGEGDRTCKMRDACGRTDVTLLALAGGVGVLPHATDVVIAFALGDPVAAIVPSPITRLNRPESPPPRV